MKASPWHSNQRIETGEPEAIYHNNTACKEGAGIEKNLRRYGTDNRILCKRCATLNAAGK